MKHWLGLAALICFGSATAQAGVDTQNVISSSDTIVMVAVSTITPTPLFAQYFNSALLPGTTNLSLVPGTTGFLTIMPGRKRLEIQNIELSTNSWVSCMPCAQALTLSSSTLALTNACPAPSATQGKMILGAGGTWAPNLTDSNQNGKYFDPWCIAFSTSPNRGTLNLSIEQGASY